MEATFLVKHVRQFLKQFPDEVLEQTLRWKDDKNPCDVTLDKMGDEELTALAEIAEANKAIEGMKSSAGRIASFQAIKSDPTGKKIAKLEHMEQALKQFLSKANNYWVFKEEGGYLLPYYVSDVAYHSYNPRTETAAHVALHAKAMARGSRVEASAHWKSHDIKGGLTAVEVLAEAGMYAPTPESLTTYVKTMERYKKLQPHTGDQYTADGQGTVVEDRYRSSQIAMVRDGVAAKLVMDDTAQDGMRYGDGEDRRGAAEGTHSDAFWNKDANASGSVALPVHPFVQVFDLDIHKHIIIHTDQLSEYKWNPKLGDKLILPPAHKNVVGVLMETAAQEIDDIIAGKSGGTMVVCTGEPGTGKTLTAEVTSEMVKRPLYKVQCSQLGTNEEKIEKTLQLVLARATRWKAMLLIDEADVYVRERGEDIQQNAIVGVFLRVLEYYRGVLFLTSNRTTVIDDAIMSRATVHLKYEKPTVADLKRIWRVLSDQFGQNFTDKFVDELVAVFPGIVGRDVMNLLKLAIRYGRHSDCAVDMRLFKLLCVHKDIEVVASTEDDGEVKIRN